MEESRQGTSLEHLRKSSELLNITKSSEIDEMDEIDILGCSDEDCTKVEVNFLTKDSDKGVHAADDSHQVIEQCMKDLVKKVTDEIDGDVPSDELNIVTHQTLPFESVKKPSSDVQVKSDGTNYENVETDNQKLIMSDFSPSEELKMKQLKKALKDIDVLSSCTEEIERMNDIFKTEVLKMLSEVTDVSRLTRYVQENLTILDDLPTCTIPFHESDGHPRGVVNVFEYGLSLVIDLAKLVSSFKGHLKALNQYRLKFIDLSETFCVNPFELHVGESKNSVLDATFAAARKIYKEYFKTSSWDILHEHFVSEYNRLQRVAVKFDAYIDKLAHHGVS